MAGKLSKTQLDYLNYVERGNVSVSVIHGVLNFAHRFITRATHRACRDRGLVTEGEVTRHWRAVHLTPAGRAALEAGKE